MNEERWLVSYADFITLLFAFFVVMFASSQVDKKKMAAMAAVFDSHANKGAEPTRKGGKAGAPQAPAASLAPAPNARSLVLGLTMAELQPAQGKLTSELMPEILAGKIEISLQTRGLVLSLKESAFFAPGDDRVSDAARPILVKVADALRTVPGEIRLEGHTDNTPIRSRKFPSNWQLSTARSVAVLNLLTKDLQLPADRFAVAGYGQYEPLDSNDTEAGRRKNRRVDLVILTQAAAAMAPS
ncbi:MAG TPA: flagellar motor protein MotB [Bryobacterales bacterium]|nr:flagellar motor protein MotB [Bryobacterales bacterium]